MRARMRALVVLAVSLIWAVVAFYVLGSIQERVGSGSVVPAGAGPYLVTGESWDPDRHLCRADLRFETDEDRFVAVVQSAGGKLTVRANGTELDQHLDRLSENRQTAVYKLDESVFKRERGSEELVKLEVLTDRWSRADALYLGTESSVFDAFFLLERTLRTVALTALAVMLLYTLSLFIAKPSETDLVPFVSYSAFLVVWLLLGAMPPGQGIPEEIFNKVQVFGHFYVAYIPTALCVLLSHTPLPRPMRPLVRWYSLVGIPLACGTVACLWSFGATMISLLVGCILWGGWALTKAWERQMPGTPLLVVGFGVTLGLKVGAFLVDCGFFPDGAVLLALRKARLLNLPVVLAIMLYLNQMFARNFRKTEDMNALLEEMTAQRTAKLEQQQSMRLGMMVNIFHDLRGPLFSIQRGVAALPRDPLDKRYADVLAMLEERTRSLGRLIEDLFTAAKLEDGEFLLAEDPVDLGVVLHRVVEAGQPAARDRGVLVTCDAPEGCITWGDEQYLSRAFENLVENAIRHASAGSTVSVALGRRPDGRALATVTNRGTVIAPGEIDHVFERYWRRGPRGANEGSSGIGLSIVRSTVERHHGTVGVQSSPGEGTVFSVYLPLVGEESPEEGAPSQSNT